MDNNTFGHNFCVGCELYLLRKKRSLTLIPDNNSYEKKNRIKKLCQFGTTKYFRSRYLPTQQPGRTHGILNKPNPLIIHSHDLRKSSSRSTLPKPRHADTHARKHSQRRQQKEPPLPHSGTPKQPSMLKARYACPVNRPAGTPRVDCYTKQ